MQPLLVVALMLQTRAGGGPAHPRRDSWLGADKVKHFFVSAFVQSLAYGGLRATGARHDASLAGASAATAALGVAKELRDRRAYGVFSVRDLTWDVAGGGSATVLLTRTVR
jgi:putative lipoprotein